MASPVNITNCLKELTHQSYQSLVKNEKDGVLPTSYYKASTTVIEKSKTI